MASEYTQNVIPGQYDAPKVQKMGKILIRHFVTPQNDDVVNNDVS